MPFIKPITAIFLLLFLSYYTKAQNESKLPAPPEGKKWIKITYVSDEFNGDKLDATKWMPKHPFWSGRNSTHTESNVSVKNGNLRLISTLREGSSEVKSETVTAACVTSNTPNCHYGYYEANIKCSNISMTSAFWFQGKYSEIDVIENIGEPSNPKSIGIKDSMLMNTHYFKKGWKKDCATPVKWKMPECAGSEYQVYGVWWKNKETCSFYHNGIKVADVTFGGPFKEKQYMFFDTEVFTWHGWPSKASLLNPAKNTMSVDWVRGWQLVDK